MLQELKQSPKQNYKTMGVMNVTPDSFSDGGTLSNSNVASKIFSKFIQNFDIVDIGAESTAPFNDPIDAKEELSRLEGFFFPLFDRMEDPQVALSIDTYRPEVFFEASLWLRRFWPKCPLIFNDVSGKVDSDLMAILKEDFSFTYVLSHNLCPERDLAGEHMKSVSGLTGEDFVHSVAAFFHESLEKIGNCGKEIILDPCFGFSKTREQNHSLVAGIAKLADIFSDKRELLVGLSRKSFLRFPRDMDPKLLKNQNHLDTLQAVLAFNMLNAASGDKDFIFRTHSEKPFRALDDAFKILRH